MAELVEFPSIQFGVEMALLSLQSQDPFQLFPSAFTKGEKGIPINGLIWMGEETFMHEQIQQKLELGFSCIKLIIVIKGLQIYKKNPSKKIHLFF